VPKCFKSVNCPYPVAETAHGAYGAINYSLVGPAEGELVVCLHGLNGSRMLFSDLSEQLSKMGGFRVLSFDLYGHGLSNSPHVDLCCCKGCRRCSECLSCGRQRGRYDLDFFIEQIEDLLASLDMDETFNLVGFSLGGTIAVAYAQKHPDRVSRLVALSPAGFVPKVPVAYYLLKTVWCCLIPAAPHVLCKCWYKKDYFAKKMGGDPNSDMVDSLWRRFVWQLFVKRGVASATLAVCHRIPWFSCKPIFKDAGKNQRPVLLIWGEKDALNPVQPVAAEVKGCFSNAQLLVVPGAGHISICDRPRQTVLSILTFLRLPKDTRMDSVDVSTRVSAPRRVSGTPGESLAMQSQVQWSKCSECGRTWQLPEPPNGICPECNQGVTIIEAPRREASGSGINVCSTPSAPPGDRRIAAASQMPMPMILGHTDAGQDREIDDQTRQLAL